MLFQRVSKGALNADRRRKRDLSAPVSSVRQPSLLWLTMHQTSQQIYTIFMSAFKGAARGYALKSARRNNTSKELCVEIMNVTRRATQVTQKRKDKDGGREQREVGSQRWYL